jgi:4-hydroxy-2-oxoheptanedioate aldolase
MTGDQVEGLREALRSGRPVLSTFVMLPRPEIVEMLAAAGFDAVVFDLEHGPFTLAGLTELTAAAQGASLFAIGRLANANPDEIGQALDAGLDGVILPHVSSADAARAVVTAGRYPPAGRRSVNAYVRGLRYGWPVADGTAEANRRVALIAMVEGRAAIDDVDGIAGIEGLDALFIGPMDLSAELGHPGEPEHPVVRKAIEKVLATMREHGRPAAIYAPSAESAARAFAEQVSLVALATDVAMAVKAFAETRAQALTAGQRLHPRSTTQQLFLQGKAVPLSE